MTDAARARRALVDVAAVESLAPGMVRVVTFSDAYVVDARDGGCTCPDKEYNLAPGEKCKHELAALWADTGREYGTPMDTDLSGGDTAALPLADGRGDERPDGCDCGEEWSDDQLPCFVCWDAGFETPNN